MRDGPLRRAIKGAVRLLWSLELGLRRRISPPRWALEGTCEGCGACCVHPTIAVGTVTWRFPTARRLFVLWQRHVNGFELVERQRAGRLLVFACTHYDPQTRQCDSYDSRPALCRDYPRALLGQPWPVLFDECTYRLRDRDGGGLAQAIDALDLDPDAGARLKARLRLPGAEGPEG